MRAVLEEDESSDSIAFLILSYFFDNDDMIKALWLYVHLL